MLHARDGAEALEILRKTPPDIVTLDVMMPKVDGWSVLGIMKSDPALEHIPVIMITIVDDRNLGYTLGASEFMTKPIDRSRLLRAGRASPARSRSRSVLIVDDDPEVRDLVRTTLEGAGLKTAQAVNGRAAIDWLDNNPLPVPDPARPDDAGNGRLRIPRGDPRGRGAGRHAGRRADRQGADRRTSARSSPSAPCWC